MSSEGTKINLRHPSIYFDNVNVNNAESAISESNKANENLNSLKADLLSIAMATPKDITPEDENPIEFIKERVNYLMEDLYNGFNRYFESNLVLQLLDDWKYTYSNDNKDIYNDCDTNEELNKHAFPEDEHVEIKRDLNKFALAPQEDSVGDSLDRCQKNLSLNKDISDFIMDKYVILTHNKLYCEYDGQFLFKSKEAAEQILKKKFDFHSIDYISKEFINDHPDFFESAKRLMEFLNYDKEYIDKFDNALNTFINNDYKIYKDNLETIYESLNKVVYERLYDICGIKILKISELIK